MILCSVSVQLASRPEVLHRDTAIGLLNEVYNH